MRTLSKKAVRLFLSQFTKNGQVCFSAVNTHEGTAPLWGQLSRAGLVKPIAAVLGHDFAFEITEVGKTFARAERGSDAATGLDLQATARAFPKGGAK